MNDAGRGMSRDGDEFEHPTVMIRSNREEPFLAVVLVLDNRMAFSQAWRMSDPSTPCRLGRRRDVHVSRVGLQPTVVKMPLTRATVTGG